MLAPTRTALVDPVPLRYVAIKPKSLGELEKRTARLRMGFIGCLKARRKLDPEDEFCLPSWIAHRKD